MIKPLITNRLAPALAAVALLFGCASGTDETDSAQAVPQKIEYMLLAEFVMPEDSLSHLRFIDDDLVSLNDRCPSARSD